MLKDRYGLAISTSSPVARESYTEGCDLLLTFYPGAAAAFDRAIAADPDFVLAHAGRARALADGERHSRREVRYRHGTITRQRGIGAGGQPRRSFQRADRRQA